MHGSFSLSFLSLAQSRGSVRVAQGLFQFIVKWEVVHIYFPPYSSFMVVEFDPVTVYPS